MFKFTLPKGATLPVITPEGATYPMVHMGDGVFLSAILPISLHTCQPLGTAPDRTLVPVAWDSSVFLAPSKWRSRSSTHQVRPKPCAWRFLDAGDINAISTQATIKAHAREAGLVVPGPDVLGATATGRTYDGVGGRGRPTGLSRTPMATWRPR